MQKQLDKRDQNRISLIYATVLSISFINYMVGAWFNTGGMLLSLILLGIMMMYSYKTVLKIQLTPMVWGFIVYVVLLYIVTRQTARTTMFGRSFMFSFVAVSIIAMYKCDTEKLLRYMSYASLLPWLFYNEIFVEMTSTKYNTGVSMGLSYAMFPLLLAPVFHFCYFRKQTKKHMYLIYMFASVLLINLILKGNRGIMLSTLVAFALIFIRGGGDKRRSGASLIRAVLIFGILIWGVMNFYDIIEWIYDFLSERDIEVLFAEKMVKLRRAGDVSNGRSSIYEYTIEHIFKKPFWGHGISTIYANSGGRIVYPHNFILQLFYDGGAVLAVPVLLVIGSAIAYSFVGDDKDEALLAMFLLCVCLPRSLFSADIWKTESFWLLVLHSMKYHQIRKEKKAKLGADKPDVEMVEAVIMEGAKE